MKRDSGFYWIKNDIGEWEVAQYVSTSDQWVRFFASYFYKDEDFEEINETRLTPPAI